MFEKVDNDFADRIDNDTEISDLRVGAMVSDHALIQFRLRVKKSCAKTLVVTSRTWRRLLLDAFMADLAASPLCFDLAALKDQHVDDLVKLYRVVMTELLDQHCPVNPLPDDRGATQSQADDTVVRRRLPSSSAPCPGS